MPLFRLLAFACLVLVTSCGSLAAPAPDGDQAQGTERRFTTEGTPELTADVAAEVTGDATGESSPPTSAEQGDEPSPSRVSSDLSSLVTELPSAIGVPSPSSAPTPVGIRYEAIGLDGAEIVPVGVEANGEMEVPEASRVGWYRFGPSPGEPGSAVLAAHIAYDGERGAFRDLADATSGHRFSIDFDDGSTATYEVIERTQYDKNELPFDAVFAQGGPSVITLISCGGSFQPSLASYEDNIVAYAVAVG